MERFRSRQAYRPTNETGRPRGRAFIKFKKKKKYKKYRIFRSAEQIVGDDKRLYITVLLRGGFPVSRRGRVR